VIRRAVIAALSALAVAAPAASAATKVETFTERVSETVSLRGAGCAAESPWSLSLPAGALNVRDLVPPAGTPLASATSAEPIATVTRTTVEGGQVTWFATGTGPACEPGMETEPWDTQLLEFSARFDIRRRVLTHRTVIARGNRICRRTVRRIERLNRRISRVPDGDIDGLIQIARKLAGAVRGMNRRFGRLAIPHARSGSFRAFRRAVGRVERHLDGMADAMRDGRPRAVDDHARASATAAAAAARHARRYGFGHHCGGRVGP
jgi:hypothetical protein